MMQVKNGIRASVFATAIFVVSAASAAYKVEILEPMDSSEGELPWIFPERMNNRGQVVGSASPAAASPVEAAFRFTPGKGMENLDPEGGAASKGVRIGPRGEVFGVHFHKKTEDGRPFLYSDADGFDLLTEGATRGIRHRFQLTDMNKKGDLLGWAGPLANFRSYLRQRGAAWVDLAASQPELDGAFAVRFNARGDIVFTINLPFDPDTELPRRRAVVLRRGTLHEVGDFGGEVNFPSDMDGRGRVAGASIDHQRRVRAYLWSLRRGLVSIHPKGFRHSRVLAMFSDGSVVGLAEGAECRVGIFVYTRLRGTEVVAGPRKLRRLGPLCSIMELRSVNRSHEFVGTIRTREGLKPFLLDRNRRLHLLQDFIDDAGVEFDVHRAVDINDGGRILVWGSAAGGRGTAALLTPRS